MNDIPPVAPTLAHFANLPRFVVWREELRSGKPTKVPYDPGKRRKARADDQRTWGTRPAAEAAASGIVGAGIGGIGIELGDLGAGHGIGGIDLDTCRAVSGDLEPWAVDVMRRVNTYAEISPSATGVKLYFLYDYGALPLLRAAMAPADWGKQWKRGGGEHPPAIELYLGNRYFAITDNLVPGMPLELATVPVETLLRLIRTDGPAFAKTKEGASKGTAKSCSEAAFRIGAEAKRNGATYDEMAQAIRHHPETSEWCKEKGDVAGGRELKRIWDRATPDTVDTVLEEFNAKYMVVNESGKAIIYAPRFDRTRKRHHFERMTFDDLLRLHMNRRVMVGYDSNGVAIMRTAADVWLRHPNRREFINGIIFDPSGALPPPNTLNLWQGFAVNPRPGSWVLMQAHIRDVICSGATDQSEYVVRWIARMVQRPEEQGEVAVVLKGPEGVGKGTLAKPLMRIFGQHALAISNSKHLTGNFNAHLRDSVFLFADEAFYAGDKQHMSVLKSIVTEPFLVIEAKYQNALQTPNYLHLMMASNEEWVVPASLEARRFMLPSVSSARRGDHAYFAAIQQELDNGGYEAMLHDLLRLDLTGFEVRRVPITHELETQKRLSLGMDKAWWLEVLHRGYVFRSKLGLEDYFGQWHKEITTEVLFASYNDYADRRRERHQLDRGMFGRFLIAMGARPKRMTNAVVGEHLVDLSNTGHRTAEVVKDRRPPGYRLGTLRAARDAFAKATGLAAEWR